MTIQDLKNLDLYKCSLQDINKAFEVLRNHLQTKVRKGQIYTDNYKELKKLHVLISRAKKGMDSKGYMINHNIDLNRLSNNESVL